MFVKPAVLNLCYFNILMFRDLSGLCNAFLLHENALVSLGFDIGILNRIDSMLSCFCGSAIDHRRPLRREMADRLAKFTRKIIIRSKIIHPMIEKCKTNFRSIKKLIQPQGWTKSGFSHSCPYSTARMNSCLILTLWNPMYFLTARCLYMFSLETRP